MTPRRAGGFDARQTRVLRDALAERESRAGSARAGASDEDGGHDAARAPLPCPACGAPLSEHPVPAPPRLPYVRHRTWFVCTGCGRSGAVDHAR